MACFHEVRKCRVVWKRNLSWVWSLNAKDSVGMDPTKIPPRLLPQDVSLWWHCDSIVSATTVVSLLNTVSHESLYVQSSLGYKSKATFYRSNLSTSLGLFISGRGILLFPTCPIFNVQEFVTNNLLTDTFFTRLCGTGEKRPWFTFSEAVNEVIKLLYFSTIYCNVTFSNCNVETAAKTCKHTNGFTSSANKTTLNLFNLIMQILRTIQEENDWVM